MMKRLCVIILVLCSYLVSGQDYKTYKWSELVDVNPDTVYSIDMSKLKLDSLPTELFQFKNLKVLDLHKNKLTKLPDKFGALSNLEVLNLGKNRIQIFPIELCKLVKLKELKVYSNDIETIPSCIQFLSNLTFFDLYDNPIREIAESMIALQQLEVLDLSGIKFSEGFQEKWRDYLPETEIKFDPPCDCMN